MIGWFQRLAASQDRRMVDVELAIITDIHVTPVPDRSPEHQEGHNGPGKGGQTGIGMRKHSPFYRTHDNAES
nr:hypothetical protein [Marinicella sp. W31]MDC2875811.1 hypothetical protein [Marinicella sp. W31]